VVLRQQFFPSSVSEATGALSRSHDVGEQHGGEDAVMLGRRANAGEEFLDLIENRIRISDVRQVIDAR